MVTLCLVDAGAKMLHTQLHGFLEFRLTLLFPAHALQNAEGANEIRCFHSHRILEFLAMEIGFA